MCVSVCAYVYIYMYIHICVCVCIYICVCVFVLFVCLFCLGLCVETALESGRLVAVCMLRVACVENAVYR